MKQTSEIKFNYQQNETKLKVVLIIIVFILAILAVTAFFVKIQVHSEDRTLPEQIAAFDFPTDYPVLEGVDPEERVLFEGFRTSFLPDEDLMLCQFNSKPKRDLPDDNDTSDLTFLWDFPEEVSVSTRLKRDSNSSTINDTARFRIYSTYGKKKEEIGSKRADYDNKEDNYVEEKEYDNDVHYEDKGNNIYNENCEEGEKRDKNNKIEDFTDFITEDKDARNSLEKEVICSTKLKRKCMNDSDNDIEVPYYYFEGSKKEKNNSVNFMSEKDGKYDIGEEDFRDYDEPHVNKGNIVRKENNATNYVNKEDEDHEDGDLFIYEDNVEAGSEKEKKETNYIDEEDEGNVEIFAEANKKTNSMNKGDKGYVELGDKKANNETNPNSKEDAICVEKVKETTYKGKGNNKPNLINKEDKEYGEKENADYIKKEDGKAKNRTKSKKHKGDKNYVKKSSRKEKKEKNLSGKENGNHEVKDYGKVNDKTNIKGKEDDEVYWEPEDGLQLKKGVNNETERGSDDGTSKWDVYDDYYEGDGIDKKRENDKSKVKHQNNKNTGIERKSPKKKCSKKKCKGSRKLKRKTNATSMRGSFDCEENEVNYENPQESNCTEIDHEDVYNYDNEPEGGLSVDKCDNNETKRGSDNGIFYGTGDEVKKDGDNDKSDDLYQDNENEGIESMVRPQTHVDRGPLDDVVEQVRGQPELEEGEMPSAVHLYKPVKLHSGIHALFIEQGDKNTIRDIQASIMRRNMDAEADPCQDFYQYACGNWAALNPIPADKAGYDTFEMLRENLDSILKDLLEFSKDEQIKSKYPGAHLDTKDNQLKGITTTIKIQLREVLKGVNKIKSRYHLKKPEQEKSEIVNRIRHVLNRKPRATLKQLKAHHIKIFNSMKRQPYQHKRRLKQKRLVKQSLKYYPRRKFTLKKSKNPDTVFHRRKIQAITGNRKHKQPRPKREVKCNLGTPSNNGDEAAGDAAMKARFLFKSCMNYGILQKRGHQPLLDLLNLLGGWPILDSTWHKTDFDWLELMAKLRVYNNDILISEWVGPDIKNSDEFVIQFDQTSLGLPTREYFLQDSNKVYLNAYKNYLIKIALLLGGDKQYVEESAEKLIDFEIKLAKITSAPEDRRNVSELYRRMTLQKLENMVPEVKWTRYLCVVMNRTVHPNETVVLFALNYVRHLVTLIHKTDSRILSNYLLWRFVRHRVNNLDDRFQSAKQQFYFILFGREQAPPRWKNCISQVNSNMGMALGSMFVKKYFDETSKNDTLTMTREIQQSFRELLHNITWIDNDTKKLAAHKVDAMMLRIGYPNFILSKDQLNERYKEVRIHPDKYFENILNILQHLTQMEQSRIGQPVNKTLWNTAPAVVNAYYSRNKNQIMFPAGILQPPFYHRHFPRSLNYGGIGVVIGHEITHGFDDKGRLFDCNGNLHRWWSDTAIESFHRRAQCLIDQYGQYVVPEVSMKLDGINTQGENIADNGGVKQAFRAYRHWVQQHGTEGETLPGLNHTHTQLFFLNFAQVWCGAMRPEAMRNKLKTAVHSPGRFRVIGTLSNSVDFAREFKCPPGSPMNPTNKCTVW